jgi:hypothetical protein
MPLLTSSVHVDQALTNVSIAYAQEQSRFVADKLFPIISTQKLTDKYFVFDKGNYLRSVAGVRAPGSETFGANYTLSTDSFSCTENGVHMDLDDLIVANADAGLNIEISTTQYITEQLLLKREKDFAAAAFTNGVWKGSTTGGDVTPGTTAGMGPLWSAANATPLSDILEQMDSVESKTGRRPNHLVLGKDVYTALSTSDDILQRVKYTQTGIVTTDLLASLLGLQAVHVPGAIENTAIQGAADSMSFVYGSNDAALLYVPATPGLMVPSAGYMFSLNSVGGENAQGLRVRNYRLDHIQSQRIEALAAYDFKVVSDQLGAFFLNCL